MPPPSIADGPRLLDALDFLLSAKARALYDGDRATGIRVFEDSGLRTPVTVRLKLEQPANEPRLEPLDAVLGAPSIAGAFTTDEVMERAAGATNLKGGDTFPLRTYVDPLFDLTFPKDFFAIRRTIDGDIVRRGGVIFTAGQLKTAEIVTVELFKVKELLVQAEALPYFPDGTIRKWSDLGNDKALAEFICERRDKEDKSAAKGQVAKARASQPSGLESSWFEAARMSSARFRASCESTA